MPVDLSPTASRPAKASPTDQGTVGQLGKVPHGRPIFRVCTLCRQSWEGHGNIAAIAVGPFSNGGSQPVSLPFPGPISRAPAPNAT